MVETFGFRNVNGRAIDIKIVSAPREKFLPSDFVENYRNYIVDRMNKHGLDARALTQEDGWTPVDTGAMRSSITWIPAQRGKVSQRIIEGGLSVNIIYGRFQEFNNPTKPYFLKRAIDRVWPKFQADISKQGDWENMIMGKRRFLGQSFNIPIATAYNIVGYQPKKITDSQYRKLKLKF